MFLLLILLAGNPAGTAPAGDAPVVRLASLELTALSEKRSEGRAVLSVTNRFTVSIPAFLATCRVRVNGEEIGTGSGHRKALRPGKKGGLEIPFHVDRRRFLAAAGQMWAVGAEVDTRIEGSLILHLPSGDVPVPFQFTDRMGTDGAREGVFSSPDGATSLSPH